jgi:hypothetical protein
MNVLQVGVGIDNRQNACRSINAGLLNAGCEVTPFEYRRVKQNSSTAKMNYRLAKAAENKDLVIIGKGELIYPEALKKINNNGTKIILWYGDQRNKLDPQLLRLLPYVDLFLHTTGGKRLREYHLKGRPKKSMFFFIPSDPEIFHPDNSMERKLNAIFTGRNYAGEGSLRKQIKIYLGTRNDAKIYGGKHPQIVKREYVNALKTAKIGININEFHKFEKCSSNRLSHYLSSGLMVLSKYSPKMELIYENKKDLVYFDTFQEFKTLLDYYIENEEERKKIAETGCKKIQTEYNGKLMMEEIFRVLNGDNPTYKWGEVY